MVREYGQAVYNLGFIYPVIGYNNLWYIKTSWRSNEYRIFFCKYPDNNCLVLLHGFQKKTQKTPKKHIEIADERKNDLLLGK